MTSVFRVGGAISSEDSLVYITRSADEELRAAMERMQYILIIEPRQQGKTSLINSVMRSFIQNNVFAYLDMTTIDQSSEISFYTSLFGRLSEQLNIINSGMVTKIDSGSSWREHLFKTANYITIKEKKLIIVLDEIGAVHFPKSTEFFSILRDLFNSRQVQPDLNNLTFILVGAFHPRDLIEDKNISPFNIAQRIRLPDFNFKQVLELVEKGSWHPTQFESFAKQIYFWTDGQPYLTQYLCGQIGDNVTSGDIDDLVVTMRREDENHLPPILHKLENNPELYDYLKKNPT